MANVDGAKRAAGEYAANLVEDGMVVGLGSGTTAEIAIQILAERAGRGLHFSGVPTSQNTAVLARSLGIPLVTLEDQPHLDLTIDGADEVDPERRLIKGHGGALLREKIVACATVRYVIIVDKSKLVARLGERFAVPVEVVPFGWTTTRLRLEALGLTCKLRGGAEHPYITNGQNYILDCRIPGTIDLAATEMADAIKLRTGVVEHGLFLDENPTVVVGHEEGIVEVLAAQPLDPGKSP